MATDEAGSDSRAVPEPPDSPDLDLVELIVIAVPDASSTAPVAEALRALVAASSIRILDVVVVTTDATGGFATLEFEQVSGLTALRDVEGEVGGWLSSDDIALASDALPRDTTALLLVTENRWARPLADATRACGGRIVGGELVAAARMLPRGRRKPHNGAGGRA